MNNLPTFEQFVNESLNISGTTYKYSELIGKKCKRKNNNGVWEIWAADEESIAIMNYSQNKPMSRRVSIKNFIKYWELI